MQFEHTSITRQEKERTRHDYLLKLYRLSIICLGRRYRLVVREDRNGRRQRHMGKDTCVYIPLPARSNGSIGHT